MQIIATQAQLDQLIQQKAKETSDKQATNKSEANHALTQNKSERFVHKKSIIDEFA